MQFSKQHSNTRNAFLVRAPGLFPSLSAPGDVGSKPGLFSNTNDRCCARCFRWRLDATLPCPHEGPEHLKHLLCCLFGWTGMRRVLKGVVAPVLRIECPGTSKQGASPAADVPAIDSPSLPPSAASLVSTLTKHGFGVRRQGSSPKPRGRQEGIPSAPFDR